MCVCVKLLHLCSTLCDPMDYSPPGSSIHGILQARILEWVAVPSPEHHPYPGIEPMSPVASGLQVNSFTAKPPGKSICLLANSKMS